MTNDTNKIKSRDEEETSYFRTNEIMRYTNEISRITNSLHEFKTFRCFSICSSFFNNFMLSIFPFAVSNNSSEIICG